MRATPTVDDGNRMFWDACAAGELRVQRCITCGHLRYPISTVCPECLSEDAAWELLSGRGTVVSFCIFRHAYNEAWRDRLPYNVALIQLEEGPRMLSNVHGVSPDEIRVGLEVKVAFEVEQGFSIPVFERAAR